MDTDIGIRTALEHALRHYGNADEKEMFRGAIEKYKTFHFAKPVSEVLAQGHDVFWIWYEEQWCVAEKSAPTESYEWILIHSPFGSERRITNVESGENPVCNRMAIPIMRPE